MEAQLKAAVRRVKRLEEEVKHLKMLGELTRRLVRDGLRRVDALLVGQALGPQHQGCGSEGHCRDTVGERGSIQPHIWSLLACRVTLHMTYKFSHIPCKPPSLIM